MASIARAGGVVLAALALSGVLAAQEPVVVQDAKLLPTTSPGELGISVALSGDRIVGGAWRDPTLGRSAGAAYVYLRTAAGWVLEQKLLPPGADERDWAGIAVDIDGDRIALGAPQDDDRGEDTGSVHVFVRDATGWAPEAELYAYTTQSRDYFGSSVAIDGDTLAAGANLGGGTTGTGPGHVTVFERGGTAWTAQALLTDPNGLAGDYFGSAVDLDGDTLVVGAPYRDDAVGFDAGGVFVFVRAGTDWTLQALLRSDDLSYGDHFGEALALEGDTLLVGAPRRRDPGIDIGAAYVFVRAGTAWTQQARLWRSDPAASDLFGAAVAVRGDVALVGAPGDEAFSGAVYRFARSGTSWSETHKLIADDRAVEQWLGSAVDLGGDTWAVGSRMDDEVGLQAGAVYVFEERTGAPGAALCFGDGSGAPCPCGNDAPTAGEGCLHSGGRGMRIAGAGGASIAADDLALAATGCPLVNAGIFYVGRTSLAPGSPLYDGLQCAGGDARRFHGRFQETGTVSDTAFVAQDPSGTYFVPGVTYFFQYWSRDVSAPSACGTGANLSPAYAVAMVP